MRDRTETVPSRGKAGTKFSSKGKIGAIGPAVIMSDDIDRKRLRTYAKGRHLLWRLDRQASVGERRERHRVARRVGVPDQFVRDAHFLSAAKKLCGDYLRAKFVAVNTLLDGEVMPVLVKAARRFLWLKIQSRGRALFGGLPYVGTLKTLWSMGRRLAVARCPVCGSHDLTVSCEMLRTKEIVRVLESLVGYWLVYADCNGVDAAFTTGVLQELRKVSFGRRRKARASLKAVTEAIQSLPGMSSIIPGTVVKTYATARRLVLSATGRQLPSLARVRNRLVAACFLEQWDADPLSLLYELVEESQRVAVVAAISRSLSITRWRDDQSVELLHVIPVIVQRLCSLWGYKFPENFDSALWLESLGNPEPGVVLRDLHEFIRYENPYLRAHKERAVQESQDQIPDWVRRLELREPGMVEMFLELGEEDFREFLQDTDGYLEEEASLHLDPTRPVFPGEEFAVMQKLPGSITIGTTSYDLMTQTSGFMHHLIDEGSWHPLFSDPYLTDMVGFGGSDWTDHARSHHAMLDSILEMVVPAGGAREVTFTKRARRKTVS